MIVIGVLLVLDVVVFIFTPKPIRTLLSSVGMTNVMLGLIAMATSAECRYTSVKALVFTVSRNSVALKDMEKSGSFKVSKWHVVWEDQRESLYSHTIYYNHTYVQYMLHIYAYDIVHTVRIQ